ncbi:MAG: carbohydrate ABC transporter permease, partial [Rhizobium sp.]|nr:carbohydrate ABC transporter permease [Rhizobium sp.]
MNTPSTIRRILTTDLPVALIVLFAMAPFAWIILTSLTPTAILNATGVSLSPTGWSIDNYSRLFRQTSFLDNMLDSLI